jgi:hypothetical protein
VARFTGRILGQNGKPIAEGVHGEVVLIAPSSSAAGSWRGSLEVETTDAFDLSLRLDPVRLVLKDGRQGDILVTRIRPGEPTSIVEFEGRGPLE